MQNDLARKGQVIYFATNLEAGSGIEPLWTALQAAA